MCSWKKKSRATAICLCHWQMIVLAAGSQDQGPPMTMVGQRSWWSLPLLVRCGIGSTLQEEEVYLLSVPCNL